MVIILQRISPDLDWGFSIQGFEYEQALDNYMLYCLDNEKPCPLNFQIWNLANMQQTDLFTSERYPQFSPDSRSIAIDTGTAIHVINLTTRETEQTFKHADPVSESQFSHDGRYFIAVSERGAQDILEIWNVSSGALALQMSVPKPENYRLSIYTLSQSGKYIYIWDSARLYIWDLAAEKMAHVFEHPFSQILTDVRGSLDDSTLIASWYDGVAIYDAKTGNIRFTYDTASVTGSEGVSTAIQRQGNVYAFAGFSTLELHSTVDNSLILHSRGELGNASYDDLAFSADGKLLIASYSDWVSGYTEVWDVEKQKRVLLLDGTYDQISPNGDLITTEDRGFIRFWGIPKADSES